MNILDALQNKQIRYAGGRYFDATTRPGEFLHVDSFGELPGLLKAQAQSHNGAIFVRFDEELPSTVPVNDPTHVWASALLVGPRYEIAGAVITWSSPATEDAWKAAHAAPVLTFDEFNIRRSGE